jgi:hypothetical protein
MAHDRRRPRPHQTTRFRSPNGEFSQRTELTTQQRDPLNTLRVPEPPRFGEIAPKRPQRAV